MYGSLVGVACKQCVLEWPSTLRVVVCQHYIECQPLVARELKKLLHGFRSICVVYRKCFKNVLIFIMVYKLNCSSRSTVLWFYQ